MPDPNTPASLLLPILVFLAAAVLAVPIFRLLGLGAGLRLVLSPGRGPGLPR